MNDSHTFVLIDTDVWSHVYTRPTSASSREELEHKIGPDQLFWHVHRTTAGHSLPGTL